MPGLTAYALSPSKEYRAFKAIWKTILQIFCKKKDNFNSSAQRFCVGVTEEVWSDLHMLPPAWAKCLLWSVSPRLQKGKPG